MSIYRGERVKISWSPQWVTTAPLGDNIPATAYMTNYPGIIETATLPDKAPEFEQHYVLDSAGARNFYIAYRGKQSYTATLSDIKLLDGKILRLPIGDVNSTGTPGVKADTLDGTTAAGATSIVVATPATFVAGDEIRIGDGTTQSEIRSISSAVGDPTLTLDYPLTYAHLTGVAVVDIPAAVYTHSISEAVTLPEIAMHVSYIDDAGAVDLMRRWVRGKVNRGTISASEGELLRMSLDEILFQTEFFSPDDATITNVHYDVDVTDPTVTLPTTEPYYFSYGVCSFFGNVFARVKSFRLEVNNNIEPKYYIASNLIQTGFQSRGPNELREGRREYRLAVTVDLGDEAVADKNDLFMELMREGEESDDAISGFDISFVFTRGTNDTITFTLPPSAAAQGGGNQGCFIREARHNIVTDPQIAVDLDILFRSMSVTVVDSEYIYP